MQTNGTSAIRAGSRYTLAEWRTWPEGERWELIYGIAYAMSPAPRLRHQRLVLSLATQLRASLKDGPCEPFIAPVDVFLRAEAKDSVVQPDLMIVCDEDKKQEDGIHGAPDWIMEIQSDATAYKDQTEKRNLYEESGVAEYWILNPDTLDLLIYLLEDGHYGAPNGARLDKAATLRRFPKITLTAAA